MSDEGRSAGGGGAGVAGAGDGASSGSAPPDRGPGSRVLAPSELLRSLESRARAGSPAGPSAMPAWPDTRRDLVAPDAVLIQPGSGLSELLVLDIGVVMAVVMAIAVSSTGAPLPIMLGGAAAVLVAILLRPDLATPVFLFVMYLNLPVVATQFHGVPQLLAAASVLVLLVPVGYHVLLRKGPVVTTAAAACIGAFLLAQLISTLLSSDVTASFQRVAIFITEGLVIYLLVSNAIRTTAGLRQAMWAILLAGAVMGGLSVWQELSGSYGNQLGGLAQVTSEGFASGGELQQRLSGPIGEKNRYAQVLIVLLPIGVYFALHERRTMLRVAGALAMLLVLAGMLLSFSRGGFIALVALLVVAAILRYVRPLHLVGAILAGALMVGLVAPSYVDRMATILDIAALVDDTAGEPDGAILGRTTSNIAALNVFLENPVFGVGPGQYFTQYSQEFANELGLRRFDTGRRAHNLYLELAADLGLVGLAAFMAVAGATLVGLWRARRRWLAARPEIAEMATAMWFAVVAYLFSAVFLHLSYERYFWALMAIAASATWVLHRSADEGAIAQDAAPLRP